MDHGKSISTTCCIPLLLDGKRNPERLDPFGSKAKKIEDYVLRIWRKYERRKHKLSIY